MDFRAVLILCMSIAQAACRSITDGAKNETIDFLQKEIRTAFHKLRAPELLPNNSCLSVNVTQLVGQERHPFVAHHLSPFLCYMVKLSPLTPNLSDELMNISQYIQDATSGHADLQNCSLPKFEQDMNRYTFLHCLLNRLDERLSKAKI